MKDSLLRKKLSQFDPSSGGRENSPIDEARRCEGRISIQQALLEEGARWVGDSPRGYLRLEFPLQEAWLEDPCDAIPPESWKRLSRDPYPEGKQWVVLDVETTGLESGTGTLVFLIGLIFWKEGSARCVQYFLPEPSGERRMLSDLLEDLSEVKGMLSFNGRCFDLNRLRTRLLLKRLPPQALQMPHLDLLHPARRIARRWLSDCRQITLEENLLGCIRESDLPGSEAPGIYRSYLNEGQDEGISGIILHNRRDVERLLQLAHHLSRVYGQPAASSELPAVAQLDLARSLLADDLGEDAGQILERIIREDSRGEWALQARWERAHCFRRDGNWKLATSGFEEILELWPHRLEVHVELAKLYEHRWKDLDRAMHLVKRALTLLLDREMILATRGHGRGIGEKELLHRLSRLQRRKRNRLPEGS